MGAAAKGIAGMHAHGVDIFDKADGDFLAFGVPHDFEFELFPSFYGFFDENLSDKAGGKPAAHDDPEFLKIINQAAAGSAHGICGTNHAGQVDSLAGCLRLLRG